MLLRTSTINIMELIDCVWVIIIQSLLLCGSNSVCFLGLETRPTDRSSTTSMPITPQYLPRVCGGTSKLIIWFLIVKCILSFGIVNIIIYLLVSLSGSCSNHLALGSLSFVFIARAREVFQFENNITYEVNYHHDYGSTTNKLLYIF